MPLCPEPILEIEQKTFDHPLCAVANPVSVAIPCPDSHKLWRSKTLTVQRDIATSSSTSVPAPPSGCGTETTTTTESHRTDVTLDENNYTPDGSGGATCISYREETHTGSYEEIFDMTQTTGTPPPASPCDDFSHQEDIESSTASRITDAGIVTSESSTFDRVLTVTDNSGTTTPIDTHCSTATFTGCVRSRSANQGGVGTISRVWDGTTLTVTTTYPNGTEVATTVMGDPVTLSLLETEADAALALQSYVSAAGYVIASTDIVYTQCVGGIDDPDAFTNYDRTNGRYRWRIPSSHTGNTFVLEWDEVFFPAGWDDVGYSGPPPTVTPKTYTWSGPADPDNPDDPDWFTPFSSEMAILGGDRGTLEIRNLRYTCYGTTPYGAPFPQASGPVFEP